MVKEMSIPGTHSFEQIATLASERVKAGKKLRTALISGGAKQGIEVFARAVKAGLIEPMVVGSREATDEAIRQSALSSVEMVSVNDTDAAVKAAFQLAIQHKIDMIFADESVSDVVVGEIGKAESGFVAKGRVASGVAVIKPQKYPKLLFLSDCAVNAAPDLKSKLGVIQNIVNVARSLEIENPRVAVLAKMAERRQIKGALVDGPLSFDVAMDEFAATSKGITQSPVAGQADAFLAPNVEVAAGVYSALSLFGSCERGSVIPGGAVPVAITMRTDTADEMLNSLYLGILTA